MEGLRAARPEVTWQVGQAVTRRRAGKVLALIGAAAVLTGLAASFYVHLPLPVKDKWVDEFKVENADWQRIPERSQWEGSAWNAPPEWRVVRGEFRAARSL
jgi:hypothetical protein